MSSQVETLLVEHRRTRFLIYAAALTIVFGLLGLLAWRLGYYPERNLQLAAETSFASSDLLAHQNSAHPVFPPLAFMAFLVVRNPIVLTALVAGISIGYLAYFATTYAGSPGIRPLLLIYILLSPSMITLSLFQLEWLMMVALVVGSYAFLLEYCRRDSGYHLFLSGLALAGAYMVVPEISLYIVLFAVAVTFGGPPRHRRSVYAMVLLFPMLSAAAGWALVEWHLTGSVAGPLPDLAAMVDTPGVVVMLLTSGPFVLLYVVLCVVAGMYSKVLRSIIIVLLIAPVVLIIISLSWASPVPAVVHVPLLVCGVIVLYPYFDTVVPPRILKVILVLLLVAAIGRDAWTVFFRDASSGARPVTELVRGGEDRGNLESWQVLAAEAETAMEHADTGILLLEENAVIFQRLVSIGSLSRMQYRSTSSAEVARNVELIIRPTNASEMPEAFEHVLERGGFELLRRE